MTGTWVLTSRVVEGQDLPVTSRLMKLVFNNNGTFRAIYRGDEGQTWIGAGAGGFSYAPPLLTLFWDSGPVVTIVVEEKDPERLLFHHSRSFVPLKNQEPDELFVRQKVEKGPTRQPS
ncbi:MAG: lipocalin family protein [Desulfomonilaceae bacterium]